jgi:hypothetical protein
VSAALAADTAPGSEHDFDFLFGTWLVHHRRLRERLSGSDEWEEFVGSAVAKPVWGGIANVDEIIAETQSGPLRGMTVRLFDPAARHWRLYWANAESGVLDMPVIGGFLDGRGEFFNQEIFRGRAIFVRYIWSAISADSCRWEQAFSQDGARTWETNWIMEFTRAQDFPGET